ncbi:Putative ribonuclease H protein At1g65750 [Linum perenne]
MNRQDPSANWIIKGLDSDSSLLFGIAAWLLWKARNDSVFTATSPTPIQIASRIKSWTRTMSEAQEKENVYCGPSRPRRWSQVAWEPGPDDWVTINTDGSVLNQNRAAAGGIIRSHDGHGLVAFSMNLGWCTVTRAELRGAITGLELAWSYGFRKIILQLDSRTAVAILTNRDEPSHQFATEVLTFRELCHRYWKVEIRHVFREANKAANFLASQGFMFPFGIQLFQLSDFNLGHILRYDCLGVSEARLILMED